MHSAGGASPYLPPQRAPYAEKHARLRPVHEFGDHRHTQGHGQYAEYAHAGYEGQHGQHHAQGAHGQGQNAAGQGQWGRKTASLARLR